MRPFCRWFALVLLMLTAQQGALSHVAEHLACADHAHVHSGKDSPADTVCARCPAYAQVTAAALGHAFAAPNLVRCDLELEAQPTRPAIDARIPSPRSRGPPSLS
jgi:hypothetical protein